MNKQCTSKFSSAIRFAGLFALCLALCALSLAPRAQAQNNTKTSAFTIFDVPGAVATRPASLNDSGAITGNYLGTDEIYHSFLRNPDGTISTFSAPVATTNPASGVGDTFALSINSKNDVVGWYIDDNGHSQAFLRTADGTFATISPPGATTGSYAAAINDSGVIVGGYSSAPEQHGFIRAADGTFTSFDAPGANASGGCCGLGTFPQAINSQGEIAGFYGGSGTAAIEEHSFLRMPDGTMTSFDPPGASPNDVSGSGATGDFALAISSTGEIAGSYNDANRLIDSYLRSPSGALTTIDAPGAATTAANTGTNLCAFYFCGTFVGVFNDDDSTGTAAINSSGTIVGYFADQSGLNHGFVRAPDGTFTTLDAPNVGTNGNSFGTIALSINTSGEIVGYYSDTNGVVHGFLRAAMAATAAKKGHRGHGKGLSK